MVKQIIDLENNITKQPQSLSYSYYEKKVKISITIDDLKEL